MNPLRRKAIEKEMMRVLSDFVLKDFLIQEKLNRTLISIVKVLLSKDVGYADIHFTIFNDATSNNKEDILQILEQNKKKFRKTIALKMKLKRVPKIRVFLDSNIEHGDKIAKILNKLDKEQ